MACLRRHECPRYFVGPPQKAASLGGESAQQIIAEVGVTAATFPSARQLASWQARDGLDEDWWPGRVIRGTTPRAGH